MKPARLRVGKIPYLNLYPIFYFLQNECDCRDYEFVEDCPSALNGLLRDGLIDASPSSSIEYLRGGDVYELVPGHSISSSGSVRSIMLFSRLPIESMGGGDICVTHQSETSVALLAVILRKFYGIKCRLVVTEEPLGSAVASHPAYLAIGDDALFAASASRKMEVDIPEGDYALGTMMNRTFFIYDLGRLWHKFTGLPFVFALWILRKEALLEKRGLLERFKADLDGAKRRALRSLPDLAAAAITPLKPEELVAFWGGISYDFTEEHRRGLELFAGHLREMNLL